MMPGIARPAIRAIPTGAPISVPTCQSSFFFLVHGFFPQNVHPVGLKVFL